MATSTTGPGAGSVPAPRDPRRTAWLVAAAAAAVGIAGGTFLGLRSGDSSTGTPTATAGATSSATTPATSGSTPSPTPTALGSITTVTGEEASTVLTTAGLKVTGKPEDARSWIDANGRNVLLLTRQVTHRRPDGSTDGATLRVVHAAHVEGKAVVLRTLVDPGEVSDTKAGTCEFEYGLDFAKGSVTVADSDGDGLGEASVGWWSQCRSDPGPRTLKLALLENGRYYILRGAGLLHADRAALAPELAGLIPTATFTPDPIRSRWPKGSYDAVVGLFRTLYG
jgi:hypothetical protein